MKKTSTRFVAFFLMAVMLLGMVPMNAFAEGGSVSTYEEFMEEYYEEVNERELRGRGVSYCATCDGEFFTGKEVYVVGGGFAAAEESVFLTKFARHVTILVRGDDFTCATTVAEKAKNHEKITVIYNTVVEEVNGENGLNYIRYKNTN